jgi:hypothetical protein
MKPNWLVAGLLSALLAGSVAADVTVNFRNNVLASEFTKVIFTFWASNAGFVQGTPVVNGNGRTFVAQLFHDVGGSLSPVGGPANFRNVPQSDPLAGTWSGANRTIVGPPADATVNLVVRVWDSGFSSYEIAAAAGWASQSLPFTYRNALSSPPATTDTYMRNFPGMGYPQVPEPSSLALGACGVASLLLLRRRPAKEKPGSTSVQPSLKP